MRNGSQPTIAVIEDDRELSRTIGIYLNGRGYDVDLFSGYTDARQKLSENTQVAIIDLNLGDGDGMKLLRLFRSKHPAVKLIIMTGYDSLPKRLQSFALGADDYMKKPIFPSELEARIKRLLVQNISTKRVVQHKLLANGQLSPLEDRLFQLLLSTQGAPVGLETLQAQLEITKAALYTAMSRLKQKISREYRVKLAYGRGWWVEKIER